MGADGISGFGVVQSVHGRYPLNYGRRALAGQDSDGYRSARSGG
jgi:hypothetical protein